METIQEFIEKTQKEIRECTKCEKFVVCEKHEQMLEMVHQMIVEEGGSK